MQTYNHLFRSCEDVVEAIDNELVKVIFVNPHLYKLFVSLHFHLLHVALVWSCNR